MAEGVEVDVDMEDALNVEGAKQKGRGIGKDRASKAEKIVYDIIDGEAGGAGPQRSIEGWIIFVTNIHEEATEEDVHEKFADFGDIKNMHLNLDRRTGFLKGYALIEFETQKEALNAINTVNGEDFLGQPLKVSWAFTKPPKGASSGGGKRR